jgi:hypothetical protein
MIRADFYIGVRAPKWIGSLANYGCPWDIQCKILVQVNQVMYEETVCEFLKVSPGSMIASEIPTWPWPWQDSQLTDYSYFFSKAYGKVFAYSRDAKAMFDPLKIMQGEDLNSAIVAITPSFPKMGANIYEESITNPI